jgi:hypothetical protein
MANKIGFDFDEFGGNVDIVIVKGNQEQLKNSSYLKSPQEKWQLKQLPGQTWSLVEGIVHSPEKMEFLAKELSTEFSTQAIYFYFGDASGWMGYKLFLDGDEQEEYSFGESYEAEMLEMDIDLPSITRKDGTLVVTNEDDQQFIFWSQIRSPSENEINTGEQFIDEFLRLHEAYIGEDLFPKS